MAGPRKKKPPESEDVPLWVLTYGDCVTLMLTFFVLLVSMAKIDESRKLVVLGSVFGSMGFLDRSTEVLARSDNRRTVEPGPMEGIKDFEPLKNMLWEEAGADLRFESNKVVQVLSIEGDALFAPGSAELTPDGRALLERTLPVIKEVPHPVLVAGHTSTLRDELGAEYRPERESQVPDLSWRLSLNRSLAVYRFLLEGGADPDKLRMEAFGRYRPRFNNNDPEERDKNRRVDLVLDLRNPIEKDLLPGQPLRESEIRKPVEAIEFQGFRFQVNATAPEPGR
jgi:Flagellar motor protein